MKTWIGTLLLTCALLAHSAAHAAPAGTLDPAFAGDGRQSMGFGPPGGQDRAEAMVQGPNGALYMAGTVRIDAVLAIGLAKLDFDGHPSASLGMGSGRVAYAPPGLGGVQVSGVALQADGRIVVAGSGEVGSVKAPMVCRFAVDGAIDGAFGDNGCARLAVPETSGSAYAVLVQPDGRIAIAGSYFHIGNGVNRAFVAQLDADGHPTDFGTGGMTFDPRSMFGFNTSFNAIKQTGDGGLVAAGSIRSGGNDYDFLVMKLDQAGAVVEEFGNGGTREYGFNAAANPSDQATAISVLPDDSLLVAGVVNVSASPGHGVGLVKLTWLGDIHPMFAPKLYDPCDGTCNIRATSMAVFSDGRILVAGSISFDLSAQDNDFFAWRLLSDGTQDDLFGPDVQQFNGLARVGFDFDGGHSEDVATSVVLQGDRVVLGGQCREAGGVGFDFCLARLDHGLQESFTVEPDAGPGGSLFPNAAQSVVHSGYAAFGIWPNPGFSVKSVTGCSGGLDGEFFIAGPVTANCSVTVVFEPPLSFTLAYTATSGGSITGEALQSVAEGGDGSVVTAVPDADHHFTQWSDGSMSNPRQDVSVMADVSVVAQFKSTTGPIFADAFEN